MIPTPPPVRLHAAQLESITLQNAANSNNNGTILNVKGFSTVILSITGTFNANINFEVSVNGTTFNSILGQSVNSMRSSLLTNTIGDFRFNVAGYTNFRARISDFVSGTVTVVGYTTSISGQSFEAGGGDVNKTISDQTASATVYTVTAGKTLFITDFMITATNTNTTTAADIRLRQGIGGVEKWAFHAGQAGVAAALSQVPLQAGAMNLVKPLQFNSGTAVRIDIISGTIRYAFSFSGFEV